MAESPPIHPESSPEQSRPITALDITLIASVVAAAGAVTYFIKDDERRAVAREAARQEADERCTDATENAQWMAENARLEMQHGDVCMKPLANMEELTVDASLNVDKACGNQRNSSGVNAASEGVRLAISACERRARIDPLGNAVIEFLERDAMRYDRRVNHRPQSR